MVQLLSRKKWATFKFHQVLETCLYNSLFQLFFLYDMLFQLFWIEATERNVSGWQHMETGALQLKTVKSAIQKQKIASKIFQKDIACRFSKVIHNLINASNLQWGTLTENKWKHMAHLQLKNRQLQQNIHRKTSFVFKHHYIQIFVEWFLWLLFSLRAIHNLRPLLTKKGFYVKEKISFQFSYSKSFSKLLKLLKDFPYQVSQVVW